MEEVKNIDGKIFSKLREDSNLTIMTISICIEYYLHSTVNGEITFIMEETMIMLPAEMGFFVRIIASHLLNAFFKMRSPKYSS